MNISAEGIVGGELNERSAPQGTNRIDLAQHTLDRLYAVTGRFDYHIEVPAPDYQKRLAILQVCLTKMKTRGRLGIEALAEATAGYSGAELAALCRGLPNRSRHGA